MITDFSSLSESLKDKAYTKQRVGLYALKIVKEVRYLKNNWHAKLSFSS